MGSVRSGRQSSRWALPVAMLGVVATMAPADAAPAEGPVIVAVGDVACQSLNQGQGVGACRSDEVAELITSLGPDRFLALGDLQYNTGTSREFARVWDVQFGHLKPITSPVPGNHEYDTAGAAGYFEYFGDAANDPFGYYSFDLGTWHIVALNSDICGDEPGCGPGSPQYDWLATDLEASDAGCTLAFQHHPVFDWRPFQKWVEDDGTTRNGGTETAPYRDMWDLMHRQGVDVVLVGHNHLYQRWEPQDSTGAADPAGPRQFTVGTGGRSLYAFGSGDRPANLTATQNKAFGVLEMTLGAGGYDYRWVAVVGEPEFDDAGSFACG